MIRSGPTVSKKKKHLNHRLKGQQRLALSSSIFLLRETGPTGFLLREEEPENKDFRVFLGNPHVCNCSTFQKKGELCKHICWVLLKRFKLPRNHEYALKLGLMEGEINDLLQGIHQVKVPKKIENDENSHIEEDGYIKQKEIDSDDICSICQEILLEKRLPVTFCRLGCGNNMHIKCMKILANYQDTISNTSMLKCPLCRKEFAPLKLILEEFRNSSKLVAAAEKEQLDKQLGIPCNNCKQFPIEGKCYKCTKCTEYHLCQKCFDSCCHPSHSFTFREKRNQRWKSVEKRPNQVVNIDIKNDVEEKMPHFQEKQGQVYTPKHVVKSLPLLVITKNSMLLAPGYQCRLCLKAFCLGQYVRLLPCTHKMLELNSTCRGAAAETTDRAALPPKDGFLLMRTRFCIHCLGKIKWPYKKCIDSWLFYKCNSCPLDGQVIYNPLIWKNSAANGYVPHSVSNTAISHLSKQEESRLFIPGTGLILKQNRLGILPSIHQRNSATLNSPQSSTDTNQNITIDDPHSIKLDDSNLRKLIYEYKISQHFPRYLQDLPTRNVGRILSQTFFPSIAPKHVSQWKRRHMYQGKVPHWSKPEDDQRR